MRPAISGVRVPAACSGTITSRAIRTGGALTRSRLETCFLIRPPQVVQHSEVVLYAHLVEHPAEGAQGDAEAILAAEAAELAAAHHVRLQVQDYLLHLDAKTDHPEFKLLEA